MGIQQFLITTLMTVLVPAFAWAGGQATISSEGVQTFLEYDDAGSLRMGAQGEDGYMLIRDGRMYTVMDQGGEIMVMEIGAAMAAMGNMIQQQGLIDTGFESFESLTDTGRTETVAGIEGRVHELTLVENNGQRSTETIVLSSDNRVREMTAAMMAMADLMLRTMGSDEAEGLARMKEEIVGTGRGILRQGNEFVVTSIDGNPPAASRLELPAEPMEIPDMSSFFGGGMPGAAQQPGGSAASSAALPAAVSDQFQRQRQRVESRTEQEVEESSDSAVDRAVNRVFNSIFQ